MIKVTGVKGGIFVKTENEKDEVPHEIKRERDDFNILKIALSDHNFPISVLTGEGSLVDVVFEVIGEAGESSPLKLIPHTDIIGGTNVYVKESELEFVKIPLDLIDNSFNVNVKKATKDENLNRRTRNGKNGPQFYVGAPYVRGELNGNGTIQTIDAYIARLIGIEKYPASPEQRTAGDVNIDGIINSADASMIIYYALNGEWPRVGLSEPRKAQRLSRSIRDGKDTSLLIRLEDVSGIAGSNVTTTLHIDNLVGLSALNLAIVYDQQVIKKVVNVSKIGLAANTNFVYHDNGDGILRIGVDTQTPMNGSGAIATITFELATGGNVRSTPLLIGQAHLYDKAGRNFAIFDLHDIEADHGEATIIDVSEQPEPLDHLISIEELLPSLLERAAVYTASGKIRDQDGNPMAGVVVKLGDQTAITDEYGYWAIVGLSEGDYSVSATYDGYTFADQACIVANQQSCQPIIRGSKNAQPAQCQLYAVNDRGLNQSQFITIDIETGEVKELGSLYQGYDIEALAIHPKTNAIYVGSGNDAKVYLPHGFMSKLDGETGELIKIGPTGFAEIGDLAFDANGTLWAWAKGEGLITIDVITGLGTLVIPSDLSVEGLTLSKDTGSPVFYASVDDQLWKYDMEAETLELACPNLQGETEALEMMAGDTLLTGTHQDETLSLHAFDPNACEVTIGADIPTPQFDDVEGIGMPTDACVK